MSKKDFTAEADNPHVENYKKLQNNLTDYENGVCPSCSGFFICIGILIAVVFSISVASIWVSTEKEFSSARFNQIVRGYSSSWNALVDVNPKDSRSETFIFSTMPQLVKLPQQLRENHSLSFEKKFTYLMFQLQQNSQVNLSYNSNCPVGFYLIQGYPSFAHYSQEYSIFGPLKGKFFMWVEYSTSRVGDITVYFDYGGDNYNYKQFYFVWESTDQILCNVQVNVVLDVYVYDTSTKFVQSFHGSQSVPLAYGKDQFIVINPYNYLSDNFTNSQVTMTVTKRFTTWLCLGLGLTLPLLVLGCLFLIKGMFLRARLRFEKTKMERKLQMQINNCAQTPLILTKQANHLQYV